MSQNIPKKQKALLDQLFKEGELIFAAGTEGVSVNIRSYKNDNEDRLDVGDGTDHVHIDWNKVSRFELGEFYEEGMITFYDDHSRPLFKFYKPSGLFETSTYAKLKI